MFTRGRNPRGGKGGGVAMASNILRGRPLTRGGIISRERALRAAWHVSDSQFGTALIKHYVPSATCNGLSVGGSISHREVGVDVRMVSQC